MKRKSIIITLLIMIVLSTSLFLGACKNKGNSEETFTSFKTSFATYSKNSKLFKSESNFGVYSKFSLNNFQRKQANGQKVGDDINYKFLCSVSMNFIDKYRLEIEELENKYDFSSLNNSLSKLDKSYENLAKENNSLVNIESSASVDVYNGYFARYKLYAKQFINDAFTVAVELGDFLYNDVQIAANIGTEEQTEQELKFYVDYQTLLVYDDFRILLLDSCDGQILENQVYTDAVASCRNYGYYVSSRYSVQENLTVEQGKSLISVSQALCNQRIVYRKAVEKFSIYKLCTTYDNSLEAYKKSNSNAVLYYEQLENYFSVSNNPISLYYTFIRSYVK